LKHALAAAPEHRPARLLQAEVFEQLGYQAESSAWRNFYLVGARELRHGFAGGKSFANAGPDLIAGMSTAMVVDYLGVRLNGPRAAGARLRIGLEVTAPEDGRTEHEFVLVVENGVLRSARPPLEPAPAGSLRITRTALAELAHGAVALDELTAKDVAEVVGDRSDLDELLGLLDTFTAGFALVVPHLL
ncbi:MAG: alkyl sulfatase C-terminal domain-containing protein, partial [Actinomycetes bacterium]